MSFQHLSKYLSQRYEIVNDKKLNPPLDGVVEISEPIIGPNAIPPRRPSTATKSNEAAAKLRMTEEEVINELSNTKNNF